MGEENQGNLDSFVDIVANTAGIMIVLVVMSLLDSNKAGSEVNVQMSELKGLRTGLVETVKKLAKKDSLIIKKDYNDARSLLEQGLSELGIDKTDSSALPKRLDKAQEDRAVKRMRLDQVTTEEQEEIRKRRAALDGVKGKVTPEEMEFLEDKKIEEMQGQLDLVEAETVRLNEEALKLAGDKAKIEREIDALKKGLKILEAQGGDTLEAGGPVTKLARDRFPAWIECYRPAEPREAGEPGESRIRLLSASEVREVRPKERGLSPLGRGETALGILEDKSTFREYLKRSKVYVDDEKNMERPIYLMFVVRPDVYPAFRLARKYAREEGWQVDWRPLTALGEPAAPVTPPPAAPPVTDGTAPPPEGAGS